MIAGVVFACSVSAIYAALAPIEQSALLARNNAPPLVLPSSGDKALGTERPEKGVSPDILEPGVLAEITLRAVEDVLEVHPGFVPSIIVVADCYQSMADNDLKKRIFCMQLDRAAWTIEKMAHPAWRAKDESANDYFTDLRFRQRQLHYAMPLKDDLEFTVNKEKFLSVLGQALDLAMRNELEKKANIDPQAVPDQLL